MALPRWLAQINKRVFNPGQIQKGKYPVVTHVGRRSGKTYETPLDAFPTKTGFVLVARYGPESDWVRNILASGTADLRVDGQIHRLGAARLVDQTQALAELAATEAPAHFTKAQHFVLMDHRA